ncbi:MAG: hypothetical protein R3D71_03425 [Rickettsiales bacterium]
MMQITRINDSDKLVEVSSSEIFLRIPEKYLVYSPYDNYYRTIFNSSVYVTYPNIEPAIKYKEKIEQDYKGFFIDYMDVENIKIFKPYSKEKKKKLTDEYEAILKDDSKKCEELLKKNEVCPPPLPTPPPAGELIKELKDKIISIEIINKKALENYCSIFLKETQDTYISEKYKTCKKYEYITDEKYIKPKLEYADGTPIEIPTFKSVNSNNKNVLNNGYLQQTVKVNDNIYVRYRLPSNKNKEDIKEKIIKLIKTFIVK